MVCDKIYIMKYLIVRENDEVLEKLNNLNRLKIKRKDLRNNSTPAENKLWIYLSNSKLAGRKFRRQHSIGNFILDFYCPKERLAIELDGDVHFTKSAIEYDIYRTKFINEYRIKVIRFTNDTVLNNIDYVLEDILKNFNNHP